MAGRDEADRGIAQAWSVADVRAAEDELLARTPPGALMQRAAAGLAAVCAGELRARRGRVAGARVVLLVGAGNNGGDALWAGARLARRGARVDALQLGAAIHAEGLGALLAAGGRHVPVAGGRGGGGDGAAVEGGELARLLASADLVVDGIVGLGASPGLREPAAGVVAALPEPGAPERPVVVAVDLPSGVDPDTGETPSAHVVADVTVTFGAPKPCLFLPPGDRAAGRVELVDLGLLALLAHRAPAVERLTASGSAAQWPVPGPEADKYRRGVLGVVAGSPAYTGAAVLATGGALRAGAGMVRYVGPDHPTEQVRLHWPEAVFGTGRVQAWTLGSGVDPDAGDGQADAVRAGLASGLPCVVDAGALAMLDADAALRGGLAGHHVLTPHAGELARLLTAVRGGGEVRREEVEARPLAGARELAAATGATVLLKGSTTLVVPGGSGPVRTARQAPAWLATAGAGDVLAGVLGALLAAGLPAPEAAVLAADVHGRAAATASGGGPLLASDVAAALPATIAALLTSRRPASPASPALIKQL